MTGAFLADHFPSKLDSGQIGYLRFLRRFPFIAPGAFLGFSFFFLCRAFTLDLAFRSFAFTFFNLAVSFFSFFLDFFIDAGWICVQDRHALSLRSAFVVQSCAGLVNGSRR